MADLSTKLKGIILTNPIMPASGPIVRDAKSIDECLKQGVGAIVTKTFSDKPAPIARPCMQETHYGGFLNSELWSEIPVEQWIEAKYEKCKTMGVPFIASIGYTAEEIENVAPLVAQYADIIEISTHYMENDIESVVRALKAASRTNKPVYIKISPGITKISWYVKKLVEEGADGFVAINSFGPCMHIDIETGMPYLGNSKGYGWLSGKSINPIALRYVYSISNAVKVPVIGVGGVSSGEDAVAMFMAGASAVQICTSAILEGTSVFSRVTKELDNWLDVHNYNSVSDIIGLTAKRMKTREISIEQIVPIIDKLRCTACGSCVTSCPYGAMRLKDKAEIIDSLCFGCGLCVSRCPFHAIKL